jgi:hypothetical protein
MTAALEPLHHALPRSRRWYTDGCAVARLVPLRIPQLGRPFGSAHAALVLATKLINPLNKSERRTTGSQRLADTGGATHKSP